MFSDARNAHSWWFVGVLYCSSWLFGQANADGQQPWTLDHVYPPLTIFDHLRSELPKAMLLAYLNFKKFLQVVFLRDLCWKLIHHLSLIKLKMLSGNLSNLGVFNHLFWNLDLDVLLSNGSGDCLAPLAQALKGDDFVGRILYNSLHIVFFWEVELNHRIFSWIVFQWFGDWDLN